jgi:hypothetical protein
MMAGVIPIESLIISPTSLADYGDCPLKWRRKYLDGWGVPDTAPLLAGCFLHKAVADFLMGGPPPLWGDLMDSVSEKTDADPFQVKEQAERQWNVWSLNSLFRAPDGVEIEIRTDDPVLGRVHCFLDYVQVPVLIDHKFVGKLGRKKDALQLAFYRRFAPCTTKWAYEVISPEAYQVQWASPKEMDKADICINETLMCIKSGEFGANPKRYGRDPYCVYCPFTDCEEKAG